MALFVSVTFIRNGTQDTFRKHKTENSLQISCMSKTLRMTILINLFGLYFELLMTNSYRPDLKKFDWLRVSL